MKFARDIPQSTLDALEAKALRLTAEIDRATSHSEQRDIRSMGGHLIDRILEWVEDIKDLRQLEDEELHDAIQSFESRLAMATKLVGTWPGVAKLRTRPSATAKRKRRKAA